MFKHNYILNIITFAALAGCLCGYMLGVISGILPILEGRYGYTNTQISMIAGSILLGCVISSAYTGVLNDFIGRKKVMFITFALYVIGTLMFVLVSSFQMIYIARLIQGIGFGMAVIVVPVYLSEVSAKDKRGYVITTFQLSITGGTLLSTLVNLLLVLDVGWRSIIIFLLALCLLCFYYIIFLPESPRWLYNHRTEEDAKNSLKKLMIRFNNYLDWDEINIKTNKERINWKSIIFDRSCFVPILLVTAVVALAQLSGLNGFIQCSVAILHQTGINSQILGLIGGTFVTAINFLATIFTLILVEKLGRRKILKIGSISMVIILICLSIINYIMPDIPAKGYMNLLGIVLMVGSFAFGPGGVLLVLCAELLPNRIRGIGLSISFTIGALVGMFFISVFLPLAHFIGYDGLFLLIAVFASCYVFIAFILPETKGKTLEDIEAEFTK